MKKNYKSMRTRCESLVKIFTTEYTLQSLIFCSYCNIEINAIFESLSCTRHLYMSFFENFMR